MNKLFIIIIIIIIIITFTRFFAISTYMDLDLFSFRCMLPYFMSYDHTNYARWGPIYLAEMHHLPAKVLDEFKTYAKHMPDHWLGLTFVGE
jgi:hypothetical protein